MERAHGNSRQVLEVGVQVLVNFRADAKERRRSCLRGWAADSYILLDEPRGDCADLDYREGATWQLYYVARGNVCVVDTKFIESTSARIGGVYVTFPADFALHPLRTHQRVEVQLPAMCGAEPTDGTAPADLVPTTIIDLSMGGCSFRLPSPVAPNARLCLTLSTGEPSEQDAVFLGTVRRVTPADSGHTVGLQFDDLTPEQRTTLFRLVGVAGLQPDALLQ